MSKKVKTKVSSSLINEMVDVSKSMGEEISPELLERWKDVNLVSSSTREFSSLKIEDRDGVLYSVNVVFKTNEKDHKLNRSDKMNDLVEQFNVWKKQFCEEVTTSISNPTVVSV